jgi:hypothetical protein
MATRENNMMFENIDPRNLKEPSPVGAQCDYAAKPRRLSRGKRENIKYREFNAHRQRPLSKRQLSDFFVESRSASWKMEAVEEREEAREWT